MNVSKHIMVRGRVQGVGYRAFVERAALKVGIAGWVRNRREGSVEALFFGDADQVQALIETCRRGPFAARVDALQEDEAAPEAMALCRPGELFSVLPTA